MHEVFPPMYVRTLSLFTEPRPSRQGPSAFVVSILVHGVVLGMLTYGFLHAPRIDEQALSKRYAVRRLDLHKPEPHPSAGSGAMYPGPQLAALLPESKFASPLQIAQMKPAAQTLMQPDLPRNLILPQEVPVPTVVTWTPQKTVPATIVLPQPQEATAADVRPSPDAPNEELNLAEVNIASAVLETKMPAPASGTTSPIVVPGPDLVQMVPTTTSERSIQPTPAAVISISDLQMQEGTIILPPANETAPAKKQRTTEPGRVADRAQASTGEQLTGFGNQPSITRISLPKKGKFGVVIVGTPLQDEYPEMIEIWGGRMAYTAYLNIGLKRSWILQYSLPRTDVVAAPGSLARLEAPWPYEIARPLLVFGDFNAKALVLHGFVNQAGRFESLALVYPPQLAQAEFVLYALQRWQFRPAKENGKAVMTEVVLIVPNDLE